ncbi:MAG: MerR family transcriptional regulator [Alphaproteobacteria bacterium]
MRQSTIGHLARETGSKVQTIRYYEEIGLLPAPARTRGNQRVYSAAHRDRLAFIRHARELGFPLEAIRELLALGDVPEQSCMRADRIASAHLGRVERKIAQLEALRTELKRMVRSCRRGRVSDCRVIEALADHTHAHCVAKKHAGPEGRFGATG